MTPNGHGAVIYSCQSLDMSLPICYMTITNKLAPILLIELKKAVLHMHSIK